MFYLPLLLLILSNAVRAKTIIVSDDSTSLKTFIALFSEVQLASSRTKIQLFENDELLFENLIIVSPSVDKPKNHLSSPLLIEYMKKGGNILLAIDEKASDHWREFLDEFGIVMDDRVLDSSRAFQNDSSRIILDNSQISGEFGYKKVNEQYLYSGIGFEIKKAKPLVNPIVYLPETTYTGAFNKLSKFNVGIKGRDGSLIVSSQSRNNARLTVLGSTEFISDNYLNLKGFSNLELVKDIVLWTFLKRSALRIEKVFHHKVGENKQLQKYRIKDDIIFNLTISEYNGREWVPFTANDLQLEIAMLDPYYRLNLQKVGPGEFSSGIFKLPDTYGVFTFRLIYQRPFLSYLKYENQVVLRPYALNEYERFITSAFPYYCNIFSNLFGFTLLLLTLMYSAKQISKEKKKQ